MASLDLTKQFINGLKKYNLKPEDMINWRYAGGQGGGAKNSIRHENYFHMRFPNYEFPDLTDECVCGHTIKENCYIANDDEELLIIGNCCIKRFLPNENTGRTCEICKKPHKNRKNNRCNECRIGLCNDCGKECGDYKKCAKCFFKN
jgi:hypothetical protein